MKKLTIRYIETNKTQKCGLTGSVFQDETGMPIFSFSNVTEREIYAKILEFFQHKIRWEYIGGNTEITHEEETVESSHS